MTFNQLMTGVAMGLILIIIGFVPGLLDKWVAGISYAADMLLSRLYGAPMLSRERIEFGEQHWVGALGMALIALTMYLYTIR